MFDRLWKLLLGQSNPKQINENPVRIGILGCAAIAPNAIIKPSTYLDDIIIQGIAARDFDRAKKYAIKYNIPLVFSTYEELIASDLIDAVYIPSPNSLHFKWAMECIKKGKHVLCEKPLTSNLEQALAIESELLLHPDLVFAEAFHWKAHPAAIAFGSIISGHWKEKGWNIGNVQKVSAAFHIPSFITWDTKNIRFDYQLGGGVTMDAGTYAISTCRYVVERFLETKGIHDVDYIIDDVKMNTLASDERVDLGMKATFHTNGIQCDVSSSFNGGLADFQSWIQVETDQGVLLFYNFIGPSIWHKIEFKSKDGQLLNHTQVYDDGFPTYYYQAKAFASLIHNKSKNYKSFGMTSIEDSVKQMKIIDDIYIKSRLGKRP